MTDDIKQVAERVLALDRAYRDARHAAFGADEPSVTGEIERLNAADAALIADYRTSAPALAREVLRLRAELDAATVRPSASVGEQAVDYILSFLPASDDDEGPYRG
jgi:hypothetical protein